MGVVAYEKQLKTAAVHSAVDYGKSQHKQVLQEKEQSLAALEETMQKLKVDAELAKKQVVQIRREYNRKWKEQKGNAAAEEVERGVGCVMAGVSRFTGVHSDRGRGRESKIQGQEGGTRSVVQYSATRRWCRRQCTAGARTWRAD
jgi:hypothetical protein